MFNIFKENKMPKIELPVYEEICFTLKTIHIKIREYEKLTSMDTGRVLASYCRANKIDGFPDFKNSKNGVYPFVIKKSQSEIEEEVRLREQHQREFDNAVLDLVTVEIVEDQVR